MHAINTDFLGLSIVFFGDSITEGQYVDPSLRWSDLIAAHLAKKYFNSNISIACANRGISGETSRQGLARYASDVQDLAPDILTIEFGLNDCNFWQTDKGMPRVTLDSYRANLEEMILRARAFDVEHIILSNNHKTGRNKLLAGGLTLEQNRKIYNAVVKEVADKHNVVFCDIEAAFDRQDPKTYNDEMLLPYPDLLHLSEKGHILYMDTILPKIENAIEKIVNSSSTSLLKAS